MLRSINRSFSSIFAIRTSIVWATATCVATLLFTTGCRTPRASSSVKAGEPDSITFAERRLLDIQKQQQNLTEDYRENPDNFTEDSLQMRFQNIARRYESYLASNPEDNTARSLYGKFLVAMGQHEKAIRQFLEVDRKEPSIPVVKQQIGNYLAENGRYMAALPYFINAADLDHEEGIYPYQLGILLYEFKDEYIRDGFYDTDTLNREMQEAFEEAVSREPENFVFMLRYGESFYDVKNPDWERALEIWKKTLELAQSELDRQVVHLHMAKVYHNMGQNRRASELAEKVTHDKLLFTRDQILDSIQNSIE